MGLKDLGLSWCQWRNLSPEGNHSFDFVRLKPLVYSKSGDRVLVDQDGEKFVWYHLTTKEAECVRIEGAPRTFEVEMCVESLVKLNANSGSGSGSGTNRKQQQADVGKKKKKKKKR
ncbi:hypothetical protein PTKIN_Ptkin11bG0096000 [Pterospermum kingtungense]